MTNNNISVDEVLNFTGQYLDGSISLIELDKAYNSYLNNPERYREENSEKLFHELDKIIGFGEGIDELYYLRSAMFKLSGSNEAFHKVIKDVIDDKKLSKDNKYFAYWQLSREGFMFPLLDNPESDMLLDDLYDRIFDEYKREMGDLCTPIPLSSRNKELVVVIISQMLSMQHVPTKVLLDRCYILNKIMNKKVLIINTADLLTSHGSVNWFQCKEGNYGDILSNAEYLDYRGCRFAFYQCPFNSMPDAGIIKEILSVIASEKPYYVLSVGGINITADLISKIVPTLTIATVFSKRAQTRGAFQVSPHAIDEEDKIWLKKHGMNESHFIQGLFSFSFKEQTHIYTRKGLGIPEGKTICVTIGARLDEEVDASFMKVVQKLSDKDIYTTFVGGLPTYDSLVGDNAQLREHMINLGYQEDVLAICECCDIYINPRRRGGGSSAGEAMYKGLPVVTQNYGDIASAVGDTFWVKNYDEMVEQVEKLATEKDYYKDMSRKAKARASVLIDSETEFVRIIHEMESRKEFW